MQSLSQNWRWYLASLVALVIVILLINSLNVLVYSGPLSIGVVPTLKVFTGKLWVLMLIPFVVGLILGLVLGLRRGRPARPVAPTATSPRA